MSLVEHPIAIFMNHIQTNRVGSIPNIYQSVQNLNDAYMKSNQTKDQLLRSSESKSWSQALELVQGLIVYMVIDDLSVSPLSMISGLSKLTNVESTTEFEVKTVEFGVNEALEFLEASFQSKTVLSETFLKGRFFILILSMTLEKLPHILCHTFELVEFGTGAYFANPIDVDVKVSVSRFWEADRPCQPIFRLYIRSIHYSLTPLNLSHATI
ncbi:hypothetical protein R3W88_014739 [Solanum pinnatisectum]|uniref:Uncharacterized protein n=1 Tax=Solanum pinnatisectum TaxID=50273 RepID=A0AAV9KT40_9SOLN|nr:hypothetical protein R3W88_014739 [Solanum pinnatisectum]